MRLTGRTSPDKPTSAERAILLSTGRSALEERTAAYDTYIQAQQSKYLSPDFAKQLAAMAKAYPAASVGSVMGLTKSGAVIGGNTANALTTLDGSALLDAQRNAAIAAAAKLKEQNSAKKGSPADFLAPLTRTAFMLLSTPFEMLEASVRNGVSGKGGINTFDETQTGQALINLFKTGKIDVGTGFLGADQNSAVGKALLNAKIAAGPTMKGGVPWTYSSGLTQALFDNPETKAARTFQAISGFVLNLAADPLTYVPGVGLVKIGKEAGKVGVTLRVGPKAAARAAEAKAAPIKAVARDVEDIMDDVTKVRAEARAASGDINMLEAGRAASDAAREPKQPPNLANTAKTNDSCPGWNHDRRRQIGRKGRSFSRFKAILG